MGKIPKSVELKLDRASEHVDALQKCVKSYLAGEPYAERRRLEKNDTEHVFVWDKFTIAPDGFSLLAGDAVHNIRSALDHLAVALAEAGAKARGIDMSDPHLARIEFPITLTDDDFAQKVGRGALKNVEPMAKAFIEASQPYRTSLGNPRAHYLHALAHLDNTDKHRTLNLVGWAATISKVNWPPAFDGIDVQFPRNPSYEVGAEICRLIFPSPQAEMDVPVSFGWGMAIPIPFWAPHEISKFIKSLIYDTRVGIIDPLCSYL